MRQTLIYTLLLSFSWLLVFPQYTKTINSNKPGESIGAFAVGQHVFQLEFGNRFEYMKHASFNDSKVIAYGIDLSARYGFFRDQLELVWDFNYQFDQLQNRLGFASTTNRNGIYRNSLGAKFLFFDPYKKTPKRLEKEEKRVDLYSWKANNKFKWRDLIPALAIYGGFNLNFTDTYAYGNYFADYQILGLADTSDEPTFSPRLALATQSHIKEHWVIVTNLSYNRIGTDFPELGFIATVTYNFNPKWTAFVESQTLDSDVYADQLFRGGAAYLFNKNLQFEATLGGNIKNTPSRIFGNIGVSFRIDNHTEDDAMSFERYQKKIGREAVKEEVSKRNEIKKERKKERKEKRRNKKKKDREQNALDEFDGEFGNEGKAQETDELEEENNSRSKVRNEFRELIDEDDDSWRQKATDEAKEELRLKEEEKELRKIEKELRKIEKEERKEEKRRQKEEKKKEKKDKKKKKKKDRDQDILDDFNDNR